MTGNAVAFFVSMMEGRSERPPTLTSWNKVLILNVAISLDYFGQDEYDNLTIQTKRE